jgi:hypothetical protein
MEEAAALIRHHGRTAEASIAAQQLDTMRREFMTRRLDPYLQHG